VAHTPQCSSVIGRRKPADADGLGSEGVPRFIYAIDRQQITFTPSFPTQNDAPRAQEARHVYVAPAHTYSPRWAHIKYIALCTVRCSPHMSPFASHGIYANYLVVPITTVASATVNARWDALECGVSVVSGATAMTTMTPTASAHRSPRRLLHHKTPFYTHIYICTSQPPVGVLLDLLDMVRLLVTARICTYRF